MYLIGKSVSHKIFGKGTVIEISEDNNYSNPHSRIVTVRFECADGEFFKKFVYPDAFEKFLTVDDESVAENLEKDKQASYQFEQKKKQELAAAMEISNDDAKPESMVKLLLKQRYKRKNTVADDKGNVALRGSFNIIDRTSPLNTISKNIIDAYSEARGKKVNVKFRSNSVFFITSSPRNDVSEKNRLIVGAFVATRELDGSIGLKDGYSILLDEQESEKILFWNYHKNDKHSERPIWNQGVHRYIDDIEAAQILRDMASLRGEDDFASTFYKRFCKSRGIDESKLPKPSGALTINIVSKNKT